VPAAFAGVASPRRLVAVLGYSKRRGVALHAICAARLERAEEVVEPDDVVLLSGWGHTPDRSEAALMAAAWRGADSNLILDLDARSTAGNARAVARHAREQGVEEVVAVTSSWHRPRAAILLRAALRGSGIRVRTVSAPRTWPIWPTMREVGCLLALPVQIAAARRDSTVPREPSA
jgi:uncharacterized SAM-binding protein YcdF (DUF218 family)